MGNAEMGSFGLFQTVQDEWKEWGVPEKWFDSFDDGVIRVEIGG